MAATVNCYEQNPIVDAFILCGHSLQQFQHGFKWEAEVVIEQIQLTESYIPCAICNQLAENGWVEHAKTNHCDGKQVREDQLKLFRLSKGAKCLMCNLVYENDDEKNRHINYHMRDTLNVSAKMPLQRTPIVEALTTHEKAIKLKTYLHFNFYKQHNINLFMLIPSWLNGGSAKEKLRNLAKPTYIPIALSTSSSNLFKFGIKKAHYDVYKVTLYTPSLVETFNGIHDYRRAYGKLLIRLLASLQQKPDWMKNMRLLLAKTEKGSQFLGKYLVHVTEEDINEVMEEVLVNRIPVFCFKELFEEDGCMDYQCKCLVHFDVNFRLEETASEPREDFIYSNRHYSLNFELGIFEFVENPDPDKWIEFAAQVITTRRYHMMNGPPTFVYVVLCTSVVHTDELPSMENRERFTRNISNQHSVYVGMSRLCGIPLHHFTDLQVEAEEDVEMDVVEYQVNEEGERILTGMTELGKAIKRGLRALYIMRQSMMEDYQHAEMLEAALQLYGYLAINFWDDNPVRIINKRIELSSLSFLSLIELEKIIQLIDDNVQLFYDSPEGLRENILNTDWGIFIRPFYFNEIRQLPL